jgi:hypothetical protein
VAVAFLAVDDGGTEELVEAEFGGEDGELVVAAGAGAAAVEFLKGDDVGVEGAEDAGDAIGGEAAVEAFAIMDVVADDAEVGEGGARAATVGGAFAAAEVNEGGLAEFGGADDGLMEKVFEGGREEEEALGFVGRGAAVRAIFVGEGDGGA